MFNGLTNLASLFKQAQQMGQRMQQINEDLKSRRATGSAGGEMVEVEVNGLMDVLKCRIQPQLLQEGDRELIEDLIVAAVNQALTKARQLHADAIKDMTGGIDIPGLSEGLGKFLGKNEG